MYQAKWAVYIGRFQPFHNGHLYVLHQALKQAEQVVVVLGSSNGPRTIKNPFTTRERAAMICRCLTNDENLRVRFVAVEDAAYNDEAWAMMVTASVNSVTENSTDVVLIGHDKDASSYYLRMFPQWRFIEVGSCIGDEGELNATQIRDQLFNRDIPFSGVTKSVPNAVWEFLAEFTTQPEYEQLCREKKFIDGYKASWAAAPYAPTFVTVDAVVVQQGHILLVKRRAEPGKGLWALPGGFLNQSERIEDAMIRELREETRLKVPDPVLRGNIKMTRVFDAPDRSLRGRTITHASLIHLPPHGEGLPEVKGSDDAEKAEWVPLTKVQRPMMFEDHMDVLRNLVSIL